MIYMGVPEDKRVLEAIGKIAIRHGQLDYSMKMAIRTLSGVAIDEAIDATERQSSRDLRERVRRLARKRIGDGEAFVRLEAILERARRATERRNELLHGLSAQELDGDPVMRSSGRAFGPILVSGGTRSPSRHFGRDWHKSHDRAIGRVFARPFGKLGNFPVPSLVTGPSQACPRANDRARCGPG
jgi:hypothetical protein